MPHFMIVLITYINLLNLSWIIKCLFLRNVVTASGYYALFPCINRSIVRSQCIFVLLVNVILRSEMDHGWTVCKPTSPPFSK